MAVSVLEKLHEGYQRSMTAESPACSQMREQIAKGDKQTAESRARWSARSNTHGSEQVLHLQKLRLKPYHA